jgi:DNA-dependent RNA polymerase auxiliary subunit epsilon
MVRDLVLLKVPGNSDTKSICTHKHLKQEIKKLFPTIDCEHTTWMTLKDKYYVIEFITELADPINKIMARVRGGKEALKPLKIFCEAFNCQAVDTSECSLIDFTKDL